MKPATARQRCCSIDWAVGSDQAIALWRDVDAFERDPLAGLFIKVLVCEPQGRARKEALVEWVLRLEERDNVVNLTPRQRLDPVQEVTDRPAAGGLVVA